MSLPSTLLYHYYRRGEFTKADAIFLLIAAVVMYIYAWFTICRKSDRHWAHLLIPFWGWYTTFDIAECRNIFFLALLLPRQIVLTAVSIAALLAAHFIMPLSDVGKSDSTQAEKHVSKHDCRLIRRRKKTSLKGISPFKACCYRRIILQSSSGFR